MSRDAGLGRLRVVVADDQPVVLAGIAAMIGADPVSRSSRRPATVST